MDDRAWLSVWGKAARDDTGRCIAWNPLYQHLDDAMAVAARLVESWVSPQVIARISAELPDGIAGVRVLASWLAGVHDVGKASPAFSVQVNDLAGYMDRYGLDYKPALANDPKRREVGHAIVGHLAVRDWMVDDLGFARRRSVAAQLASVVGSHHGVPPERAQLSLARDRPDLAGTGVWHRLRWFLLDRAADRIGGQEILARYRNVRLSLPSQALLTAIVIVADWIASNDELFPLRPVESLSREPEEPDDDRTRQRLEFGWSSLRLPAQWSAQPLPENRDQLFQDRFGYPDASLNPIQRAAIDAAVAQGEPGMLVIEAPMGSGKTEASLLAAEALAGRSGADGVFIALPTQATTDAMFSRVRRWLDKLPGSSDGKAVSLRLAHGKAHLNDEFAGMVRRGRYGCVGDGEASIVHAWFSGRKKAVLAAFVVGTIDQVLFAGLKSRHLMLRHLALAGKVVVIDEVHAYDVYMSQYLHRVLHWLGAYRVPVVLLSATLPPSRRSELLQAYDTGRGRETPDAVADGYPQVSGTGFQPVVLPLTEPASSVQVDRIGDDLHTLAEYLTRNLSEGGCAVVIRNTVARVQETAEHLSATFGMEAVTINHARFLACDRAEKDRDLLRRFGPKPGECERPDLHIVVASQVVEQSLDIDFDLMVTDLAPVDLVLQRLGRLHRHQRARPAQLRQPRCALVGVLDWDAAPVVAVSGSRSVYGEYPLLRAAAILHERDTLRVPHDIAPLVHTAYGHTRVGPASWQPTLAAAEHAAAERAQERRRAARDFLLGESGAADDLCGWVRAGVGDVDDDSPKGLAQVRDGEESLEVLVVQRDAGGGLLVPAWVEHGGEQLPLDEPVPYRLARVVAACSLRLPYALSHSGVIDDVIRELEANRFTSFEKTPQLTGQLVLVLDQHRQAELNDYRLTYDLRRGLIHERI